MGVARFFGVAPSRAGEEGRKSMQMKVVGQVGEVVLQSFDKYDVALLPYQRLFNKKTSTLSKINPSILRIKERQIPYPD